ncbi:thiaminase II [Salinicola halophilus]|uniref:thiaminase II n=1 Tax=Salinicola halophilus TaxID=184065 RepID=UPI000DA19316|nr:thiaminase II [Salinicola halophilus]
MGYCFTDLTTACQNDWHAYIEHDFVRQLGNATLPEASFRHYLKQDYLFLTHFARAYALAAYKSATLADLRQAHESMKAIVDVELDLHVGLCGTWGVSEDELAAMSESRATLAYTRYVLDTGSRGDLLDLHVAMAPCLIGYGEIADRLNARASTVRGAANPFDAWLAVYEGDEFQAAVRAERTWLDARLAEVTSGRFAELARIFRDATRLEIDFWQMGLDRMD